MSVSHNLSDKERKKLKEECTSSAWKIGAKKGIFTLAATATGDASVTSTFEIFLDIIQLVSFVQLQNKFAPILGRLHQLMRMRNHDHQC